MFAVDSDTADLAELRRVRPEHRILIGEEKTGGQGAGGINELGGELARANGDRIINAAGTSEKFLETDAFLLIASAAGGTGSGAIAVVTQRLKGRYPEKMVYNLIVTPFDAETADEKTITNTATCLKSAYSIADAIFLVDNQRYAAKGLSIEDNALQINTAIIEPFYELLSAGEEKTPAHIGAKTIDAGDIIQTLAGWTVIGQGKVPVPRFRLPILKKSDFRDKFSETDNGIQALNRAISELSLKCNPADAKRALYLLAAPAQEMGVTLFALIGSTLRNSVPDAIMRSGDYPRSRDSMSVTVLLSELVRVEKVTDYFTKAANK